MGKPLCVELCAGKYGWAPSFLRLGYQVIGFDVVRHRGYPGELVLQDVRTLEGSRLRCARVIVASPPCTEFSSARRAFWGVTERADLSVVRACFRIAREARVPIVLENVHGLQQWLGPAIHHWGKFYLWGDGVPALLPQGPRWKDRTKMMHRSPLLRARIPTELSEAVARFHLDVHEAAAYPG